MCVCSATAIWFNHSCWFALHLVLRLRGGMQIFVKTLTGKTITMGAEASKQQATDAELRAAAAEQRATAAEQRAVMAEEREEEAYRVLVAHTKRRKLAEWREMVAEQRAAAAEHRVAYTEAARAAWAEQALRLGWQAA